MKKYFYIAFLMLATVFAGCEKVDDPEGEPVLADQLVGTWVMSSDASDGYTVKYIFDKDMFTVQEGEYEYQGTFALDGDVLTMMVDDSLVNEVKLIMLYDNNVLVMRYHSGMGEGWGIADEFGLFYRENGSVKASLEDVQGKWYWYFRGNEAIIRSMLEIDGSNFDFIIPVWRERMKGTIEYQNGKIQFQVTEFLIRDNLDEGNESLENLYLYWRTPTEEEAQWLTPSFGYSFAKPFVANGDEAFGMIANLPAYFVRK